jgi:Spy/CpxP family protein refolding chaperone
VNGRRVGNLVLAASLGLNLALAGVLIYNEFFRTPTVPTMYGRGSMSGRGQEPGSGTRDWRRDDDRDFPRLDREQLNQMRRMREGMQEEIGPLWEQIRSNQALLQAELLAERPDRAQLDSLSVVNARLQERIQLRTLRLILEEREVLTREQYEHFLRWMVPGSFGRPENAYQGSRSRRETDRPEGRPRSNEPPPTATAPPPHH